VRLSNIVFVLLLVFPAGGLCLAETGSYDWESWGAASDTLRAVKSGERLDLSSPFIVEQSERVTVNGSELASDQYEINYQRGLVRIRAPIPEGAVVVISYTRFPFLLNSVYSLRGIEFAEGEAAIPPRRGEALPPMASKSSFESAGNLVFGGVKSISFTVGSNRGASFDQALRATVEGDLTPTIHVKALLSDDNLPIQPEGNTQELEYLDKVYVEITGSRAGATLGDITFANSFSDFNPFTRELKGAMGSVQVVDRTKFEVAGGSSKGVFRTKTFRGTDQLQGPYELLLSGGVGNEVIIAGTEKVYFDGELLLRGQNRDYTIDYDRGTLRFTARRPVTADREISVDFEVTQEQYDRTSVFGSALTEALPGGVTLRALAAKETDDADRPKSVTFGEEDRGIIEQAGDDARRAVAEGASFVGEGKGHYVVVPGDTAAGAPEHFEFDDSTGAYDVIFAEVGSVQGDYVLDGVSIKGVPIYRFVGAAKGNYIVGKRLPLPQSHTVYTARLSKEGASFLDFDLQYNVSDFDGNTLSALGDDDNIGDAGEAKVRLKRLPLVLGTLDVVGSVSTVLDRYRSLERTRTSYFYRDWNLENEPLKGREILQELASSFARTDMVKLDYQLGRIERDDFRGVKQEVRASVVKEPDRRFASRVFATDVEGERDERTRRHGDFLLAYGVWKFIPSAEYAAEEYLLSSPVLPDSGISYDRYAIRLTNRREGDFSYALYAEERDTEELTDATGGWVDTRTDQTFGGSVAARRFQTVQGEILYTHRIRDDKATGGTQSSDLARLNGLLRGDRIGVRSTVEYEIGQNRERLQQKSVVFVGEGKGDYNALGDPVGKGRGAYTVVLVPTQETIPTQRVDFTWNLSWKAPVDKPKGGLLSWLGANVSLNQSLNVKEENTMSDAYKVYLLFPSALQRDESTRAGIVSLRQEWSLLESYPDWSLSVRYQRDDEEENRFNDVYEERFFEQEAVRVDHSLTRLLSGNLELRREVKERGGKGLATGTGSTYDVLGWTASAGWGVRLPGGSTLDGEMEFRDQEDFESTAKERALTLRPRFVWHISNAFNVFGRYEITRFTLPIDPEVKPLFFSDPGTAHRWAFTPNLRVSKVISLLATYQGRAEKTFSGKRIVDHELTVETRAFF
jgi:3',5'-cyclic AMP phosphodiesterase CpdA